MPLKLAAAVIPNVQGRRLGGDRAGPARHKAPMDDLAARIAAARRTGAELAAPARLDLGEGYRVQAEVAAALGPAAGWKIGATSAGAQAFLGVDGPIFGRVIAAGLHEAGEKARLPGARSAEAEPEVLLRIGPGGVIGAVHLGLEINRPSRADAFDLGAGFIVADNAAHAGLVIGPALSRAVLDDPAALRVALIRNGAPASEGDAAAVMGSPVHALAALAAARPLAPGDWIATGAMARACPFAPGDTVEADFGAYGRVVLRW